MAAKKVEIGFIRGVHGVRGELWIDTFDPSSRSIRKGSQVWVGDGNVTDPHCVRSVRYGNKILVTLDGLDDRDAAERLKGQPLSMLRSDLPELPEGELYLADVIGYRVVTAGGALVGELQGIVEAPAQPLLEVLGATKRHLIPAVGEIVIRVDHEKREVVIDPPEGLLEL